MFDPQTFRFIFFILSTVFAMKLFSARCYRRCGGVESFAELKITLLALYGPGEANPHAQDDRAYHQEDGYAHEDDVLFKSGKNSDKATVKDVISQIEMKISSRTKTACSRTPSSRASEGSQRQDFRMPGL